MYDSGADITIIGGKLFRKVATAARLKKRDFHKPDKTPRTYDQKPFTLDGRMNLDISFDGRTMNTAVYVKMDAHDQLLLSEGVCRQLGIITYHRAVQPLRGGLRRDGHSGEADETHAKVPTVRVSLVQSLSLLPHQSSTVQVRVDPYKSLRKPLLVEHDIRMEESTGFQMDDALIEPTEEGLAQLVISNPSGCSRTLSSGTLLGEAVEVTLMAPLEKDSFTSIPITESSLLPAPVNRVQTTSQRKQRLQEIIEIDEMEYTAQLYSIFH